MRTLAIIPAYNEVDNITETVAAVRAAVPDIQVVVVDDGSEEETAEAALRAGAEVLPLPFNVGYGAALQVGYFYAIEHGFDEVLQLDADGQHDPECIPDLLDALRSNHTDVVLGSRFLGGGLALHIGLARRFAIAVMRVVMRLLFRKRITDPTSGYQALSSHAVRLYASREYPSDYPDLNVLVMLCRNRLEITEVPVRMYARVRGESMHDGLKPIWYGLKMLLSVSVMMLRRPQRAAREDTP